MERYISAGCSYYSDGIKTTSEVTLIANGNSFLIDYMKSEYIE